MTPIAAVAAPAATSAGAAAACPDANLIPQPGNLARVRAAVVCLVNEVRERRGETPLRADARLEAAAQGHSEDMTAKDYFEHIGPRGDTPLDRMRANGYAPGAGVGYEVGENIAWGTLSLATPRAIVDGWVHSPDHLANILDARFRDTAVGVSTPPPAFLAQGQAGAVYTQDFGSIVTGGAARYNLRPSQTRGQRRRPKAAEPGHSTLPLTRRHKGYGRSRQKGRNRHRLGKRHRKGHRRVARGAGRKRAHQRSRRRRR
jgi:uncharacterized protein YkwD